MKKEINIAFFDTKSYDIESFDKIKNKISNEFNFNVKYFSMRLNKDTVGLARGYQAICVFVNDNLNAEILSSLKRLGVEIIALRCAGYNNIDIKKASELNIKIVRVPAYSPNAVAEHALALMLTINRKIHKAYNRTREGNFALNGLIGFNMFKKTIGIIGTGQIGKCLIKIMQGFDMKILAYDKFQDNEFAKNNNFEYTDLDTLYRNSDIISLHCPLTEETKYIINRTSISKMKKNVVIINTGRGELIDTKELIRALKNNNIKAAGLDVYEEESNYFFEDFSSRNINDDVLARLLTFPNVLITSHQAFFTEEALENIANTTLNNIKSYFNNENLQNEVVYQNNIK